MMLIPEDLGRRVRGKWHDCRGSIVRVHNQSCADIRWDFGARWNFQTVELDFIFIHPEQRKVSHEDPQIRSTGH